MSKQPHPEELLVLAEKVAGWAKDGEEVEAFVAQGSDTEVVVYDGEVESLSAADSAGIGIRVVRGNKQGFAYAGSLDPTIISETFEEARDNTAFATPDEFIALAHPDGVAPADLDLWRDDLADYSADAKVNSALELEKAVRAGDKRIRQVESSEWGDGSVASAVATSTGIRAASRRTGCYVSAYAIAGEGDDTQTGGGYSVGRGPTEIDLDEAASDAVERATRMLGAKKPPSEHLTVVFEPRITATLLSILAGTLDGESVLKGRSLFADRIGEMVATSNFTLVDNPTDPEAYGAARYDAEGLACRRNVLISDGKLEKFLYNTYAAKRAGTKSTASAVRAGYKSGPGTGARALMVTPGKQSAKEIMASVGNGLLVQSISGVHSGVNPVSGDFSVGAEGVLIRGGEMAQPVREFTIASTLQKMLQGVVAVGNDLERLPSAAAGVTLAVSDISMSGV